MATRMSKLLVLAALLAAASSVSVSGLAADSAAPCTLHVKGMCCKKESGPAVQELHRVSGVQSVKADHKAGTLVIEVVPGQEPSPRALWEAAARVPRLTIVKLVTARGTYTEKPRR